MHFTPALKGKPNVQNNSLHQIPFKANFELFVQNVHNRNKHQNKHIISQDQNKSQPLAKYHIHTFIKFYREKIKVTVLLQVA